MQGNFLIEFTKENKYTRTNRFGEAVLGYQSVGPPTVSKALALKCEIPGGGVAVSGVEDSPAIVADTSGYCLCNQAFIRPHAFLKRPIPIWEMEEKESHPNIVG